jgi:hypothetical protein
LHPLDGALTKWKRLFGRFLFFTEQIGLLHSASSTCKGQKQILRSAYPIAHSMRAGAPSMLRSG